MARDVGDGPQHQNRCHRQFERQGGDAEKAANTARDAGESRGEPRRGALFGRAFQRFERDLEAFPDRRSTARSTVRRMGLGIRAKAP